MEKQDCTSRKVVIGKPTVVDYESTPTAAELPTKPYNPRGESTRTPRGESTREASDACGNALKKVSMREVNNPHGSAREGLSTRERVTPV